MEKLFPLESCWILALVSGAVAIFMLWQLTRSLPAQNIIFITLSLLVCEGLLQWGMDKYSHTELTGSMARFLGGSALLWLAVVLSARRLAQFILRPWRRAEYYGIWLLGMSAVAAAAFQFGWPGLDVDPELGPIGLSQAMILAGMRALSTLIILACLGPWFIRKQPRLRRDRLELPQQPKQQAEQNTGEQAGR
jgi:hypothetical protein